MYNILISGYYGFNNIGDESILRTVIDNLREKLPDVDITVLSQCPAQTEEKYGVRAARRMNPWDIFRSLRHCDMLLSGGGSLLQDATSRRSILFYRCILRLAQLLLRAGRREESCVIAAELAEMGLENEETAALRRELAEMGLENEETAALRREPEAKA